MCAHADGRLPLQTEEFAVDGSANVFTLKGVDPVYSVVAEATVGDPTSASIVVWLQDEKANVHYSS